MVAPLPDSAFSTAAFSLFFQPVAGKNVIAENHGNGIISDKLFADDKCLSQTVRAWLHCITKFHTELVSIA